MSCTATKSHKYSTVHECCAEIQDTDTNWVLVEPVVDTSKKVSIYTLSCSGAGSYECSVSRMRWLCRGKVTLEYSFKSWFDFAQELEERKCIPAGPLMNIKVTLGELEEIHLPHFLCLGGGEASICDAVKVLHWLNDLPSLVCEEKFELTRHHARIVRPSLSPIGVIWWKALAQVKVAIQYTFNPKVHCELLFFCTNTVPLRLHVYLVPQDPGHIEAIHQKEREKGGKWIRKPGMVGPLQLDASVCVRTSCQSKIQPPSMDLWPLSTSNFCEVDIDHPDGDFDIEINRLENGETVCKRRLCSIDYQNASEYNVTGQDFIDEYHGELIQRVTAVDSILDYLKKEKVISQEFYIEILNKSTSQAKMRELLAHGNIHSSPRGKAILYEALLKEEPFLVEDLTGGPVTGSYRFIPRCPLL